MLPGNLAGIDVIRCPTHPKDPLSIVCIDKSCDSRSLLCFACFRSNHKNHESLTLQQFHSFVSTQNISSPVGEAIRQSMAAVKQERTTFFSLIRGIRQNIEKCLSEIEEKGTGIFEKAQQRIRQLSSQIKERYDNLGRVEQVTQMVKVFAQILKEGPPQQIHQKTVESLSKISDRIKNFSREFQQVLRKQGENTNKSMSLISSQFKKFSLLVFSNCRPIYWSTVNKNKDISIKEEHAERIAKSTRDIVGAISQQSIPDNFTSRWTVEIGKISGYVYLGVCFQTQIMKNQLEWQKQNLNSKLHGHYMVTNHGITISHHVKDMNHKPRCFKFGTGEVVNFEYRPKEHKLLVSKPGEKVVELVVDEVVKDSLRICVYFSQTESAVSLSPIEIEQS